MSDFVAKDSIVRVIWGKSDTVLLIFAGAAAEFALNKAVDWLYFTGKLPADPLGRLFSTVAYARQIVFSETEKAHASIDLIQQIHQSVEQKRGATIPDWAYRDVLFMLIHYSIAAHELLESKLTQAQKQQVYEVFYRVGDRMGLQDLPQDYGQWLPIRDAHLHNDLQKSDLTQDLFRQYQKHLGSLRYVVLRESQKLIVPQHAKKLLGLSYFRWLAPIIPLYKMARMVGLDWFFKKILLPDAYKDQIRKIDVIPG